MTALSGTPLTETTTRPRSRSAAFIAKLVALCAVIPYALVALGLRLVMARLFFLSGQAKIDGPRIPIQLNIRDLEFTVILPVEIKDTTFQMFETQYANLPIAPSVAAIRRKPSRRRLSPSSSLNCSNRWRSRPSR